MAERVLVADVEAFIRRTAESYGQWSAECFAGEMRSNCMECGLESPIEDMFWVACAVLCKVNFEEFNPSPDYDQGAKQGVFRPGVYLSPQAHVGPYRVDFLLLRTTHGDHDVAGAGVVVELDGHDFQDKNKKQRSYEKARDRYFVKAGYRVIHFTGSDIVADPTKVAHEALSLLGVVHEDEYEPGNPLGIG